MQKDGCMEKEKKISIVIIVKHTHTIISLSCRGFFGCFLVFSPTGGSMKDRYKGDVPVKGTILVTSFSPDTV